MYKIYNNDCLEELKQVEDNTIDLIIIDPPYNIDKEREWDKWKTTQLYVEFMGKIFKEIERILKPNGSFYFFHNDFEQVAKLQNNIDDNTQFSLRAFIIWDKKDFRAISWKNPTDKNKLRTWFNTTEYILYYTFENDNYLYDINKFEILRNYFEELFKFIGLSKSQIKKQIGECADHCFRFDSTQWALPTQQTYDKLIEVYKINNYCEFLEFEQIQNIYRKYIDDYLPTHKLDKHHNNIFVSNERNNGKLHPTQKPIDILERLILTSSNEGEVVLDCFMGSGSTGVAAIKNKRKFIGIERNKNYFDISKKRLENIKELL